MKTRFAYFIAVHVCLAAFCFTVYAQVEYGTTFPNGITVARMTEYSKPWPKHIRHTGVGSSKKNTIHRVFIDDASKTYFGYDLEVIPHEEKDKFKIIVGPLSIRPKTKYIDTTKLKFRHLPNYPGTIVVKDGDTIVMDILENPETKEKITDLIRVTRKKKQFGISTFADLHRPRDFTLDEVNLKLKNYEIFVNTEKVYTNPGGNLGGNIGIYLPGRGRFIISPFRREGYKFQKVGTIVNNKLTFSYEDAKFEIVSESPILGEGGKWRVWILFEKDWFPTNKFSDRSEVLTQSGSIEGFFKKGQ